MASILETAQWIESWPVAAAIRESGVLFPLIESVHVLAITFVLGTIGMIDLRLLGVSARNHAVTKLSNEIVPWTWGGFVVAAITGGLLFSSQAHKYVVNFPMQMKMIMMALAGVNMLIFEFVVSRSVEHWDSDTPTPTIAKVSGTLSLLFWIGVVVFGRWIGFTIGS